MAQALALKYRPHEFSDLCEQQSIVKILTNQIETNTIKHGYLLVGPAGCGKTTSARIFANMINKGEGAPIELDAASNNSVDDIRKLIEDAQTKALDSEYKVFVIDECHMITPQGWNAFLKTLEEPPAKSIFIMCTTNPEKVPATILSRVQRYNFQKISTEGIIDRLHHIVDCEFGEGAHISDTALEYIAKLAEGGMRDAITLLDKCLSYSEELTVDTVVEALGVADYDTMFRLVNLIFNNDVKGVIEVIDNIFNSGIDLKQFVKTYFEFILDINIYRTTKDNDMHYVKIPVSYLDELKTFGNFEFDTCRKLLDMLVTLQFNIKYEHSPKSVIVADFILFMEGNK